MNESLIERGLRQHGTETGWDQYSPEVLRLLHGPVSVFVCCVAVGLNGLSRRRRRKVLTMIEELVEASFDPEMDPRHSLSITDQELLRLLLSALQPR